MAVVSVKTLHDGWSGSFTSKEMPTFTVVYAVEVDDPQDGNILVKAATGIPRIGSYYKAGHEYNVLATCKSLTTTPVSGTRNLWHVTASFGKPEKEDDDPTDGKTEDGDDTDDPLKFAVSMSISSTRVARDAVAGVYLGQVNDDLGRAGQLQPWGFNNRNAPPIAHHRVHTNFDFDITNDRAITNSVFRPFDPPPQVEYNRTNVKLKWNQLNAPKKIQKYVNTVNSEYIIINIFYRWDDEYGQDRASHAQVHIPPFTGRILGLTTTPNSANGIGFHDNELEIEIDKLYTWRLDILDRGYATLDHAKTFGDSEGKSAPVTNADVTDDGFANREPVLLDGQGNALDIKTTQAVYLRYAVYPEIDWHAIDLHQPKKLKDLDD